MVQLDFLSFPYERMKNSLENSLSHVLVGSQKETVNGFSIPKMAVAFSPFSVIG